MRLLVRRDLIMRILQTEKYIDHVDELLLTLPIHDLLSFWQFLINCQDCDTACHVHVCTVSLVAGINNYSKWPMLSYV